MGFLKNIIRNTVDEGISKGIREAVSSATEKIVAPKAEAYANKVAQSLDQATDEMTTAGEAASAGEKKSGFSALEESLNRLSKSAEQYAATMEAVTAAQEDLMALWENNVPEFPMWCFGGKDFRFDTNEENADGTYIRWFYAEGCTQEELDLYRAMLRQNGFVRKYASSDEVLYKDLGGVYVLLGTTDAFGTAPIMSLTFQKTKDRSEIEI